MINIFRKRKAPPKGLSAGAGPVGPTLSGAPLEADEMDPVLGEPDPVLRFQSVDEAEEVEDGHDEPRPLGRVYRPRGDLRANNGAGSERMTAEEPAPPAETADPAEGLDSDEQWSADEQWDAEDDQYEYDAATPAERRAAAWDHGPAWTDGDAAGELPKFRAPPTDSAEEQVRLGARARGDSQAKLWEAFTPTKPKRWSRSFAGRRWAIQRVITAVEEEQAHVVIYGARGIGKTSLANVLAESASEVEYQVLRCPCSADITFEEIFRSFLRSLPSEYMDRSARAKNPTVEHFEQLLPRGAFGPTELTVALSYLKLEHVILIIDEFDRVANEQLKNQLAETIKNLSDISARITFIIVGIARNLEDLLGKHQSIQRHLVAVHLPLMDPVELRALIEVGEETAGVRFDEATRETIISFAKGLPYYAQLICLYSGRHALDRGATVVEMGDLKEALAQVLDEADPLTVEAYEMAIRGKRKEFMNDVLFVAARSKFDQYGTFTAADAAEVILDKSGRKLPELTLHKAFSSLALQHHGPMLEKQRTPTGVMKYNFANQTMRQYILVRQARQRGLI